MPLFIDKNYILSHIPQEKIFAKYGVPYREGLFKSTLRDNDTNPSCSFYVKNGKLIMKDFSGHFWGDCFDLVQVLYNVKYGDALQIIGRDFGLEDGVEKIPYIPPIAEKQKTSIRVKRADWTPTTLKFWQEYGITLNTLDLFNTYPAEVIWLNSTPIYKYHPSNPAFIYHFGEYNYQIYFPLAKPPNPRFLISNGKSIHGFAQLPLQGDVCIITKSGKDVRCLYEYGFSAIAPIAESVILSQDVIDIVQHRFKHVISLMDYDNTGIHNAWTMRKNYNVKPYFFAEGVWNRRKGYKKAKDFSDFSKLYGKQETLNLINNVIRNAST